MGEGLGGTVAANMAAHHPSDFNHMVTFFVIGVVFVCWFVFVIVFVFVIWLLLSFFVIVVVFVSTTGALVVRTF